MKGYQKRWAVRRFLAWERCGKLRGMMKISVKLFASLGDFAPKGESAKPFTCEIKAGATLIELIHQLGIPPNEAKLLFVNGRTRQRDYLLQPGDEVGIFPPIGGG
jgi:sulfur-carrier protein